MISFQADIAKEPCFGQENVRKVFLKKEVYIFHHSSLILVGMKTWWLENKQLY